MAVADLVKKRMEIISGNDNIVIVENIESIRGGRTLDVTGFAPEVIPAGHVIIKETSTGEYKPMPINAAGDAYEALPSGHVYAGILVATILKEKPFAGIMQRGTVNPAASTFPLTSIMAAIKTALPTIIFRED